MMAERERRAGKPPLRIRRIAGELIAALIVGIAVAAPLSYAAATASVVMYTPSIYDNFGFGALGVSFIVGGLLFLLLFAVFSAIGVYAVGNLGDETGSFWYTLAGGIVGGVFALAAFAASPELAFGPTVLAVLAPLPIGPVIAFNLTRRYKTEITDHLHA